MSFPGTHPRRYVIVGAGAIGGTLGVLLADRGRDVLLVARGQHARVVRDNGLRLVGGTRTVAVRMPVIGSLAKLSLRGEDVVVLAVKSQDAGHAIGLLSRLQVGGEPAGIRVPVVCAQNGAETERAALRRFARVYGAHVFVSAAHLLPGVVEAPGLPSPGVLDIGRYPHGTDDLAHELAETLSDAGFDSQAQADIMAWKYTKLLANLANAIEAVVGTHAPERFWMLAREEGVACYRAAGIARVPDRDYERRIRAVRRGPKGTGSSWQSLRRRAGSIETDYLNGEIVLLGRWYGVPTPVNEALQHAANRLALHRRPPGSVTAGELDDLISAIKRR